MYASPWRTSNDGRKIPRPGARGVVTALLAVLIGMLAGGALNAALGEQGADTPALAPLGAVLALGVVLMAQVRRRTG